VNSRLGKAAGVFRRLNSVRRSSAFNLSTKLSYIRLYYCRRQFMHVKTWKSTVMQHPIEIECISLEESLQNLWSGMDRYHVTNCEVLKRSDQRPLQDIVAEIRFKFADTLRQVGTQPAKCELDPSWGHRKRGRLRRKWRIDFP